MISSMKTATALAHTRILTVMARAMLKMVVPVIPIKQIPVFVAVEMMNPALYAMMVILARSMISSMKTATALAPSRIPMAMAHVMRKMAVLMIPIKQIPVFVAVEMMNPALYATTVIPARSMISSMKTATALALSRILMATTLAMRKMDVPMILIKQLPVFVAVEMMNPVAHVMTVIPARSMISSMKTATARAPSRIPMATALAMRTMDAPTIRIKYFLVFVVVTTMNPAPHAMMVIH
jgi:hypothetical protein